MSSSPAILVLEDGTTFTGLSFGAIGQTIGEAVFATGMTGYQETLTDPSYHRQIVVATAVHIGNTGWNNDDGENFGHSGAGRIWVAGFVVREPSPRPSNWRSRCSLDDEMVAQGVVGICGVDTRALTVRLRESGAMRVGISSLPNADPNQLLAAVLASPPMLGADLAKQVSTPQPYTVAADQPRFTVASIDLGIKASIVKLMAAHAMTVHVLPGDATISQIEALHPDGVFFPNGPGDPATAKATVRLAQQVLDAGWPLFGICFGHQVFGQALGFETYKLRFGHHGINQPVIDLATRKVQITAHNHGFAVDAPREGVTNTDFGQVSVSHLCLNDSVVEGLVLSRDGVRKAFSVQYHPEAAAGPHDARHLFGQFADLMAASEVQHA